MPSAVRTHPTITKFTNCRLVRNNRLVGADLWVSSLSGKILRSQEEFYEHQLTPDQIVDLDGRILAPGFIDVQLNGAQGFDFSVAQDEASDYQDGLQLVNKGLIKTGVTSYLPTLTSQRREVYHKVLPFLGPSGGSRIASNGAESLGAHCEGPFMNPLKNGIHNPDVLLTPQKGFEDLEDCYGASNLHPSPETKSSPHSQPGLHTSNVKLVTLAPELPHLLSAIPRLSDLDIVASIGHTDATYEQGQAAVTAGATMITHLFNAMRPFGHRNPGIFGLLGQTPHTSPLSTPVKRQADSRPYFGIIADGIHLHPTSIKIAFNSHPSGLILVTDAMRLAGLPDGTYDWTNGDRIIKKGALLTLEGTDGKIAGSSITLIDCVNNFLHWSGSNVAEAVKAVTSTPAAMLGLQGVKGSLESDADADLVVLDEDVDDNGVSTLRVDQVWKFGTKEFDSDEKERDCSQLGTSGILRTRLKSLTTD